MHFMELMIRIPMWRSSARLRVAESEGGLEGSECLRLRCVYTAVQSVQFSLQPSIPVGLQTPAMMVGNNIDNNGKWQLGTESDSPSDSKWHRNSNNKQCGEWGDQHCQWEDRKLRELFTNFTGIYHDNTNNNFDLCFASINSSPGGCK